MTRTTSGLRRTYHPDVVWDEVSGAWKVRCADQIGFVTFRMFAESTGAMSGDHPAIIDAFLALRRIARSGFGTATHGIGDDRLDDTALLFRSDVEAAKVQEFSTAVNGRS